MFPGLHEAGAVIGTLALACFVTGFIVAWLLRTGYVMAQTSWAKEQMEHKVRYWQSEAIYARAVAGDALCQLAAITGRRRNRRTGRGRTSSGTGPVAAEGGTRRHAHLVRGRARPHLAHRRPDRADAD